MTIQEANELIDEYHSWDNQSCTCFQNAPCAKCVGQPAPEDLQEAMEVVNDRKKLIADKCDLAINRFRNIFSNAFKMDNKRFIECALIEVMDRKDLLASYAGLVNIEYDYRLTEDMEEHLAGMIVDLEDA